jgi:guanine nucleotide-binding protein alpha-1 subunit
MDQASDKWDRERHSWRAVIHLNLVRAVNAILQVLDTAMSGHTSNPGSCETHYDSVFTPTTSITTDAQAEPDFTMSVSSSSLPMPLQPFHFTTRHATLKMCLSPLRSVEDDLKKLLGAAAEEITELSLSGEVYNLVETPFDIPPSPRPEQEFSVRSHATWRASVLNNTTVRPSSSYNVSDSAADIINALRDDIIALWEDTTVQELLKTQRLTLEESAE